MRGRLRRVNAFPETRLRNATRKAFAASYGTYSNAPILGWLL